MAECQVVANVLYNKCCATKYYIYVLDLLYNFLYNKSKYCSLGLYTHSPADVNSTALLHFVSGNRRPPTMRSCARDVAAA